jgi:hypothetical protein
MLIIVATEFEIRSVDTPSGNSGCFVFIKFYGIAISKPALIPADRS